MDFMEIFFVLNMVSIFSAIGVLLFLATKYFLMPNFSSKTLSYVYQFAFTVASGVVTYFITDSLFGHGTESATATSIATAAVIGLLIKIFGDSDIDVS